MHVNKNIFEMYNSQYLILENMRLNDLRSHSNLIENGFNDQGLLIPELVVFIINTKYCFVKGFL